MRALVKLLTCAAIFTLPYGIIHYGILVIAR